MPEATPGLSDAGGWRADVLASEPGGSRRIAFEVQLAGMTAEEGRERTARYRSDGIETVWLTCRAAPWLWQLPGCQVAVADASAGVEVTVTRGLANLQGERWRLPIGVPLARVVDAILCRAAIPYRIGWFSERVPWGETMRWVCRDDAVAIVPAVHVTESEARERARAADKERERHKQVRRGLNIAALYAREEHLLAHGLADADAAVTNPERVWVGVPPTPARTGPLGWRWPCTRQREDRARRRDLDRA